jgi:competence protein ComEA
MHQLQLFVSRVFRLEKPVDRRLLWAIAAALALFAYLVFTGLNDSSSSAKVPVANLDKRAQSTEAKAVTTPTIYVHVVGAVVSPGIYVLDSNSRVIDAIFAASGFSRKADQASVNLARAVTDGEQINVAKLGASQAVSGVVSTSQPLRLNTASEMQLEDLPSIGPTLASRIIDWRNANGGFRAKSDLLKVPGIGDRLFSQIKDLVTL